MVSLILFQFEKDNNGIEKQVASGELTWIHCYKHGSPSKVAGTTSDLGVLPVAVEGIGGVCQNSVRLIAMSIWLNGLTVRS